MMAPVWPAFYWRRGQLGPRASDRGPLFLYDVGFVCTALCRRQLPAWRVPAVGVVGRPCPAGGWAAGCHSSAARPLLPTGALSFGNASYTLGAGGDSGCLSSGCRLCLCCLWRLLLLLLVRRCCRCRLLLICSSAISQAISRRSDADGDMTGQHIAHIPPPYNALPASPPARQPAGQPYLLTRRPLCLVRRLALLAACLLLRLLLRLLLGLRLEGCRQGRGGQRQAGRQPPSKRTARWEGERGRGGQGCAPHCSTHPNASHRQRHSAGLHHPPSSAAFRGSTSSANSKSPRAVSTSSALMVCRRASLQASLAVAVK